MGPKTFWQMESRTLNASDIQGLDLDLDCTDARLGNGRVERLVELLEEKEKDRQEREQEREKLEFQLARKGSPTVTTS
jgi:hypothetical protein